MKLPYGVDAQEFANLKAWAMHPANGVALAWHAGWIVFRSLLFRIRPRRSWYPPTVRRQLAQVGPFKPSTASLVATAPRPPGPSRIRLAIGYLEFVDYPDWRTTFEDGEQYVSLHRWNWLLRAVSDEAHPASFEWGVAMMRSWLAAMSALPEGLASESYTTGERISNALMFARLRGGSWKALPDDIRQALVEMAVRLAHSLEYYGEQATGNHPLNNARALYFAGQCLERPTLTALARFTIEERLGQIVTVDGFMREGSSHYHFLFTRWLLELHAAAVEFDDNVLLRLLSGPVRQATARCLFFLVPGENGVWAMPSIGDVSPDCEPEWLLDLPWSNLAAAQSPPPPRHPGVLTGWAGLWPRGDAGVPTQTTEPEGLKAYPQSGWYRLDWNSWTAIWRAEAGGGREQASHAHQDFASLVLYKDGREVLIDIGRASYQRVSHAGNHAVTFAAHNAPLLDGVGPMLTPRDRFLPRSYRSGTVKVSSRQDGEAFVGEIVHDGYRRKVGVEVQHSRSIRVTADRVVVSDAFVGRGEARIDLHLQWPTMPNSAESGFTILRESVGLSDEGEEFMLADDDGVSGWRFPAYGTKAPSVTQKFTAKAQLPAAVHHTIQMKG